jgi:hypothetical protein
LQKSGPLSRDRDWRQTFWVECVTTGNRPAVSKLFKIEANPFVVSSLFHAHPLQRAAMVDNLVEDKSAA